MDDFSSIANHLVTALLPPDVAQFIQTNILHPQSPFQTYKRQLTTIITNLFSSLTPILNPLFERLAYLASENEGLLGLAITLTLVAFVFLIVSWVHRMVMWWTRLAMRAVFWTLVVGLCAWAWQRGLMETARDVVVVGGKIVGFLAAVQDTWRKEYQKYEDQSHAATSGRRNRSHR